MKGQYTASQLRRLVESGQILHPVMGAPVGQKPVIYEPRVSHDPRPWTDGTYRYQSWELGPVGPHAPGVSPGAWAEQRHLMDPDDNAFTHMFDTEDETAGVAA